MSTRNITSTPGNVGYAKVAITDSADLVALVTGKRIRVLSYNMQLTTATTLKFQSGASTDLTGAMSVATNGRFAAEFNPLGHFETAVGEKLNIVLGAAQALNGHLTYQEVG